VAYIYEVSCDIRPDQMSELEIGASLERVLGYLRTLLPSQPGFITARAMHSLDIPGKTHLIFESAWNDWEDVDAHRRSSLAEGKVLNEFQPHVDLQSLSVQLYREVD
jgi:heme-degrading monooxygenase HmoA